MAPSATTPLLSALQRLRMGNTPDAVQATKDIKDLLARGANPNEPDNDGLTPLAFFYTDTRAIKAGAARESKCWQYKEAIKDLVQAGADPMCDGGVFYSKTSYQYRIVAGTNINAGHPNRIENFLACFESIDLAWGDNFASSGCAKDPICAAAVRSSDGKNILHVLWGTVFPREITKLRPEYHESINERAWTMTRSFWDLGADMYAPDDTGQTPASFIGKLLEDGLVCPDRETLADIQSANLQTTTPASHRSARMGRL